MSETGYIDYRQKLSLWGEATIDGHRHSAANDSQALGCHHRFAGQYYDEESELHYNRFRYYSPETGQYLSHDPIGLQGGFNPYGYVFDPTGWIDPLGLNGCGASTPSTEPHGNSKDSTKTQHLYEIYDVETGDVLKTGISGSSLNKNGTSPRANRQVSKLNGPVDDAHPPKYAARIIDDSIPDRKTALQREFENAQKLHDEGNSMSLHKRPRPWEKQ